MKESTVGSINLLSESKLNPATVGLRINPATVGLRINPAYLGLRLNPATVWLRINPAIVGIKVQSSWFKINPLVPEIFFGEFFSENLGAGSYWYNNEVRKTGKLYLNV